ncbi:tRNA dihydrouridine(20/20a) synthase DusA [Candidatus Profftia tarda]|nr:tRNA dihydrouridine(20/20a) synthase DusA [Candidatus Profftia tarda]
MFNRTDRHCRYFYRKLSQQTMLYTEMVMINTIIHGKSDSLAYSEEEHPLALQLAGNDPKSLAYCARLAEKRGYDEINLNVGCPSPRVQKGFFGACMMKHAHLVSDLIKAMRDVTFIPITVKTRIGIDYHDSYEFLHNFIEVVSNKGECNSFIVHARKALLYTLSPKENREIPPLDYQRVYRLKRNFPNLNIIINGGIKTIEQAKIHLNHLDGVMIGREVYKNPGILAYVDRDLFNSTDCIPNSMEVVRSLYPYIERELSSGTKLGSITRHILGLFQGIEGAQQWRRYLTQNAYKPGSGIEVVEDALKFIINKNHVL